MKITKHNLSAKDYNLAKAFCQKYGEWKAELNYNSDAAKGISYDLPRVQTSAGDSSTETFGIKRANLQRKIDIVEDALNSVTESEALREFIRMGLTVPLTYEVLTAKGIPCGRTLYYQLRKQALFLIAQKI